MPNLITVAGVVGTDNVQPLYDATAYRRIWFKTELYLGQAGHGKNVPKVGDVALDVIGAQLTYYIVTDVNASTAVPTLMQAREGDLAGVLTSDDILLGVGVAPAPSSYRLYINKSTVPYTIAVDERCYIGAVQAAGVRIFLGSDIQQTGQIVSMALDANGQANGTLLGLQDAANGLKPVSVGYTNHNLINNQLVTAVVYSVDGIELSHRQLLVEETTFVRSTASAKTVSGISLQSDFVSSLDSTLLEIPANLPTTSLNLKGTAYYTDGTSATYPVDGSTFSIYGLEDFVSTQAGQTTVLMLNYTLQAGEGSIMPTSYGGKTVSARYQARTLSTDVTYGWKLYVAPVWTNATTGWSLRWYFYNLSRNAWYDVTGKVTINSSFSTYNPTLYGQVQPLSVSINLNSVNALYRNYVHTQVVYIVLARQGTERLSPWSIGYSSTQEPKYGVTARALAHSLGTNNYDVRVDFNMPTQAAWLQAVYTDSMPLYSPATELAPPVPTHFVLNVNGIETTYSIASWNAVLNVRQAVNNNSTLAVRLIRRLSDTDLQLSIAPMILWLTDATWAPL